MVNDIDMIRGAKYVYVVNILYVDFNKKNCIRKKNNMYSERKKWIMTGSICDITY